MLFSLRFALYRDLIVTSLRFVYVSEVYYILFFLAAISFVYVGFKDLNLFCFTSRAPHKMIEHFTLLFGFSLGVTMLGRVFILISMHIMRILQILATSALYSVSLSHIFISRSKRYRHGAKRNVRRQMVRLLKLVYVPTAGCNSQRQHMFLRCPMKGLNGMGTLVRIKRGGVLFWATRDTIRRRDRRCAVRGRIS